MRQILMHEAKARSSIPERRIWPAIWIVVALFAFSVASISAHGQTRATKSNVSELPDNDISQNQRVEPPNVLLDRAVDPDHYIIGPGDRLLISFYDIATPPMEVEVLPEGVVSITGVGEVKLGAITLREAKQRIISALKSRFRDRAVTVSLSGIRSFKVSVTGAVKNPGGVVVTASDRVAEAIREAGGRLKKGSARSIRLISDSDTLIADLSYYAATGESDKNPYLHEGYEIFVPAVSDSFAKIESYGALKMPGVFEYRPGDRLSDLLALSFGPALNADLKHAELLRFAPDDTSTISKTIDLSELMANKGSDEDLLLQQDDRLFVRAIAGFRPKEQVQIVGEVKFPGSYPIQPGCETLSELIEHAGGLLEGASLDEAEMYRSTEQIEAGQTSFEKLLQLSNEKLTDFELQYLKELSAQKPGRVAVDFNRLLKNKDPKFDVRLEDGDYVRIPRKSYAVTVLGRVVNPGQVPYRDRQSVDYYIQAAGGFGYKANKGDIRIIKANTGAVIEADNGVNVGMGDKIMVPQKKPLNLWGTIRDVGFFLANVATVYIVIHQAVN